MNGIKQHCICHPDRPHRSLGLCQSCYNTHLQKLRGKFIARNSTCHPDRENYAMGLCDDCYDKRYKEKNGIIKGRRAIQPECHPHRKHLGRGMCSICYSKWFRNKRKLNREFLKCVIHPEKDAEAKGLCKGCLSLEYRNKHPEKVREFSRRFYHKNIDKARERVKEYRTRPEVRARLKKRLKVNINYRLRYYLRKRLYSAIKMNKKSKKTMELIGCDLQEFKGYLESNFKPGMTWNNYGRDGWVIDHIQPCCSFDLSDPEQQKRCFHYSNLQPLWWLENIKKGGKILTNYAPSKN